MINKEIGFKQELDVFTAELRRMDNPNYRKGVYFACKKWILAKGFDRAFTAMVQILAYGLFVAFCLAFCVIIVFSGVLLAKNGIYHFDVALSLDGHVLLRFIISIFIGLSLSSMLVYLVRIGYSGRFQYDDWRLLKAAQRGDNGALVALYKLYLHDRYDHSNLV